MDNFILKIYKSRKDVFNTKELALISGISDSSNLNSKLSYYVKTGKLIRLSRGIFVKNKDYDIKELANSVYSPSYISFETVLRENGIIFQHYNSVFLASKVSREVDIDSNKFVFRKLKDIVLYNSNGIIFKDNYSIATKERAFLDMVYLFPDYYFDNLFLIDWDKCRELVGIYKNKELIKRLDKYYKNYAK